MLAVSGSDVLAECPRSLARRYAERLGLQVFDPPYPPFRFTVQAVRRAEGSDAGVDWLMQHSSMTRDQAMAEVERYVAFPGQALAYKIGELKIRELRRRAERALGAGFDVLAFHDRLLLGGSRPLTVLERDIDRWIAAH